MPAESQHNETFSSAALTGRRIGLLIALPICFGLGLSFLIFAIQWLQQEQAKLLFIGLDGMNVYLACFVAILLTGGVCIVRFKPRFRTLCIASAMIVAAGMVSAALFRIDGYYGNRTPRITWRWSPRADIALKSYLASNHRAASGNTVETSVLSSHRDFPELLGRGRNGKVVGMTLDPNWDSNKPTELWRHPVGLGWSSFVVAGNSAVTLEQRDEFECVVCYDLLTGAEIWCHQEQTRFKHEYGDGPRSTPTVAHGRVFSLGATGVLTCVELVSGKLLWKHAMFQDPAKENLIFGMTGSPIVIQDLVVVTPGVENGGSTIAFSVETGEEKWRTGNDQASYASPVAAIVCGEMQILSFNGAGLRSISLDGQELWLQPWVTQGDSRVNVAQPIVHDETKIVISSGYDRGTGLLNITRSGDTWNSEVLWESKQLKSKLSNIVVHDQHVFGLDNGILACIALKDGERNWKSGRYGHGKILLVQDKLLIQAESGEIVLVEATGRDHRELGRFDALSSKTWNYLALAGDVLVVRSDREAAAYRLPARTVNSTSQASQMVTLGKSDLPGAKTTE